MRNFFSTIVLALVAAVQVAPAYGVDRAALETIRRSFKSSIAGEWKATLFETGVPARAGTAKLTATTVELSIDGVGSAEVLPLTYVKATRKLTAGPSALGTTIALAVDPSGIEAWGSLRRGARAGELVLRRDTRTLEALSAASIDLPPAAVKIDFTLGEAPFAQQVRERAVKALTVTAQNPARPVVLSPEKARRALDSIDQLFLARQLAQGKVPGSTFAQRKAVFVAVLDDAIARTNGAPTVIRDMVFASLLLRRGVPFAGIMFLYVPLKDTLSHGHGEGVEFFIDPAHRSRMVSTKDVVSYMNSLDHGLFPTSYPKYFGDVNAIPPSEEAAFMGALIDMSLLGKIEPEELAKLGPRARSCLTDYAGVMGAELYRVFIKTPEPIVRGELIVPFAQNMAETTLLSVYTRRVPEIVVADVTTPSALPTASIDLLPASAGNYWVPEHDFTPRLADRRLMQRLLTEWLRTVEPARVREIETLMGARKKDLFQDLSVYMHRVEREDVARGDAARVSALARALLDVLGGRAGEAHAFLARKVEVANAIYAARGLPNLGDLWYKHTLKNLHAFWASLTAAERGTIAAGFDRHLRERQNRDIFKQEGAWYDRLVARKAAAIAGADPYALAYVQKKLAWSAPVDAAALAEGKARIETASHPKHAAAVAAAKAILDALAAKPDATKAVGISAYISDELFTAYMGSWSGAAPDLATRGKAKILSLRDRIR